MPSSQLTSDHSIGDPLRYTIANKEWVEEVDVDRVQEVKERFLQLHGVLSIQDFICGWFHGAPYDQIRRGNVLDFVAYGFYSKQPKDLTLKVGAFHEQCKVKLVVGSACLGLVCVQFGLV